MTCWAGIVAVTLASSVGPSCTPCMTGPTSEVITMATTVAADTDMVIVGWDRQSTIGAVSRGGGLTSVVAGEVVAEATVSSSLGAEATPREITLGTTTALVTTDDRFTLIRRDDLTTIATMPSASNSLAPGPNHVVVFDGRAYQVFSMDGAVVSHREISEQGAPGTPHVLLSVSTGSSVPLIAAMSSAIGTAFVITQDDAGIRGTAVDTATGQVQQAWTPGATFRMCNYSVGIGVPAKRALARRSVLFAGAFRIVGCDQSRALTVVASIDAATWTATQTTPAIDLRELETLLAGTSSLFAVVDGDIGRTVELDAGLSERRSIPVKPMVASVVGADLTWAASTSYQFDGVAPSLRLVRLDPASGERTWDVELVVDPLVPGTEVECRGGLH